MQVTIIIPNYNGKHFLTPCLQSLKKQTCQDFKTIIVDNASTDGSLLFLQQAYPTVSVIALRENYGFSRAVNEGIKQSTTPYVILLNNDTTTDPNFVAEMVQAIQKSPRIFSTSSKMLQMHNPLKIDSAGDLYTLIGWGVNRGTGRFATHYKKNEPIFSACAGAAIYRRNAFSKIGYFDETHFAYLEDIDIGYRAKIYGYYNTYATKAIVYHVGSGTSGSKYNTFKVKLSARNSIWLNYKNMPLPQLLINFLPLLLGYLVKTAFFFQIGFGKDYIAGLKEGLQTLKHCNKVPFKTKHLPNYIGIEIELIKNTFLYVSDWVQRKITQNET
ncbi:MAG: glycosyltransferase family 2 protein [Lachnospiraceae bacterium]|nr:glycosyltransferase family 2 protein [Lachnospiraceae bacterium]